MAFQSLDSGTVDVIHPILGSALNIPKGFWEPGSIAAHKGHFGQGALTVPFNACGFSACIVSATQMHRAHVMLAWKLLPSTIKI